jgi:hypothetical protein
MMLETDLQTLELDTPTKPLYERLAQELDDILIKTGAHCDMANLPGGENIGVTVDYDWTSIMVVCGPNYPLEAPRRVLMAVPTSDLVQAVSLDWEHGMGLFDVVSQAFELAAAWYPAAVQRLH